LGVYGVDMVDLAPLFAFEDLALAFGEYMRGEIVSFRARFMKMSG
jgi:hypothetical protein